MKNEKKKVFLILPLFYCRIASEKYQYISKKLRAPEFSSISHEKTHESKTYRRINLTSFLRILRVGVSDDATEDRVEDEDFVFEYETDDAKDHG